MRYDLPIATSLFLAIGATFAYAGTLPLDLPVFQFEQEAKRHCPADVVVWVTRAHGIYDASTERWYGRTSNGAFACLKDAKKAGFRANTMTH